MSKWVENDPDKYFDLSSEWTAVEGGIGHVYKNYLVHNCDEAGPIVGIFERKDRGFSPNVNGKCSTCGKKPPKDIIEMAENIPMYSRLNSLLAKFRT